MGISSKIGQLKIFMLSNDKSRPPPPAPPPPQHKPIFSATPIKITLIAKCNIMSILKSIKHSLKCP